MNWVGGSRSRVLIKQDRRKQKEYFERNRLKSKMKLLGVLPPAKNSTVSLDLLNLYMVNQISCKKKIPETVKKPVHVNMNRDIKIPLRKHDLELPMSPNCTPSKLCLDDTEDNIHSQELGSKKKHDPVQLSQHVTYSVFEPQFHRTENYSYPSSSFCAELSSNRHSPRQTCTPGVAPSPWEAAYEKTQNEQLSKVNSSDSLVSKLNDGQDIPHSSYKIAHYGTLFGQLQSPGNENFLTPAKTMSVDYRSMNINCQSDFITKNQPVQDILGDNGKEFSSFFGDMTQPTHGFVSENEVSFVNQNIINLLNIDQQRMKETFDKCGHDNLRDTCALTPSENHPINGCIRGIFTAPEPTFSCYPESFQSSKNYQKEYNDELNDVNTCFEKNCYPANSGKKGKLKNDYQEKIPQKNTQKYLENYIGAFPLEDTQFQAFGLGEDLMEEGGTCSLQGRPVSAKKTRLDSSQSSLSASYSPRPTESSFSSSSDMLSEDEGQLSQQIEDSNKISPKTAETVKSFYPERMGKCMGDQIVKDNAEVHTQNESSHEVSLKNNTDECPQSQCNSTYIEQTPSNNNCIVQVPRCDAGVQTERKPALGRKIDATVQCSILSECVCRSSVSPLDSRECCSENIKEDTTGGQESLE
ncbi:regulator of DNA class I crossover intermediates 1 [Dipodomys merriami]|uniref:regulator of DNA class I crossover intermediates 1 n=1 Tax=Dipodomys merriami TaxID=94247 RepID=UPI00384D7FA3